VGRVRGGVGGVWGFTKGGGGGGLVIGRVVVG
jgi:hypothetical protein